MAYVPILLDMEKINVVIFGGGKVASRKLEYFKGANITVISENFTSEINGKNIKKITKKIDVDDDIINYINDADLVIIATDNRKINSMIMDVCEKYKKLFNLVDDRRSKVIFPAFKEYNGIILAISTSGRVPALSSYLRDKLSNQIKEYSKSLQTLEKIRKSLNTHNQEKRRKFFHMLFKQNRFWEYIRNENYDEAFEFAISMWRDMNVSD